MTRSLLDAVNSGRPTSNLIFIGDQSDGYGLGSIRKLSSVKESFDKGSRRHAPATQLAFKSLALWIPSPTDFAIGTRTSETAMLSRWQCCALFQLRNALMQIFRKQSIKWRILLLLVVDGCIV
jgi:hypothetical protein